VELQKEVSACSAARMPAPGGRQVEALEQSATARPHPLRLLPRTPTQPPHTPFQLDREKQAEASLKELASIISRYRGPLLESSVDLEQRIWHLATMTGEVRAAGGVGGGCGDRGG
jgi:hypothetical protein